MPFTANDLMKVEDKPALKTVGFDVPLKEALAIMVENDFSQLPVVDEDYVPVGIITNDAILDGIIRMRANPDALSIRDIVESAKTYSLEDDIFDMLEGLQNKPAVLIVDSENRLNGIITTFDTTQYFRRRAEDIMLVEDTESLLKEHIQIAFTDPKTGSVDEDRLQQAIDDIANVGERTFSRFERGVKRYMGMLGGQVKHDYALMREACETSFDIRPSKTGFDDLTFYHYTELLFHDAVWNDYSKHFNLDKENIRHMLSDARTMRNRLAHFRDELTYAERRGLRRTVQWLQRHLPEIELSFAQTLPESEPVVDIPDILPVEDEIAPGESRYHRIGIYLQSLPADIDKVELTFKEIEEIIEHSLPPSAYRGIAWWANDTVSHVQSKIWLEAGWRVAKKDLSSEQVVFTRIQEQKQAYIQFFQQLIDKMRSQTNLPIQTTTHQGKSWMNLMNLPTKGTSKAAYICAFKRAGLIAMELYIDTGDQDLNKAIFDGLYSQLAAIERDIGQELSWERLNTKRASRIALYRDGSIDADPEQLEEVQNWAVEYYVKFHHALTERTEAVMHELE